MEDREKEIRDSIEINLFPSCNPTHSFGCDCHENRHNHDKMYLLSLIDSLRLNLERARTYRGIEGYPCPLCAYGDGKFIERCQMHKDLNSLRAEKKELVEAGEAILSAGYIFNTLKQAIEKIKEDK